MPESLTRRARPSYRLPSMPPGGSFSRRTLPPGAGALVDLWGDTGIVRMAVFDAEQARVEIAALACPDGKFPSLGRHHPPAIRLERTIRDLYGLEPLGAPDARGWLDHGAGRCGGRSASPAA